MTRRSRAPHDPTAENGLRLTAMRDDLLGRFLDDALTDREKVVVVAALCYLESPGYLPSHGLDRREAELLVAVALSKLRAHGRLMPEWDDLAQFRWDADLAQSRWDDLARYVEPT